MSDIISIVDKIRVYGYHKIASWPFSCFMYATHDPEYHFETMKSIITRIGLNANPPHSHNYGRIYQKRMAEITRFNHDTAVSTYRVYTDIHNYDRIINYLKRLDHNSTNTEYTTLVGDLHVRTYTR